MPPAAMAWPQETTILSKKSTAPPAYPPKKYTWSLSKYIERKQTRGQKERGKGNLERVRGYRVANSRCSPHIAREGFSAVAFGRRPSEGCGVENVQVVGDAVVRLATSSEDEQESADSEGDGEGGSVDFSLAGGFGPVKSFGIQDVSNSMVNEYST